MPLARDSPARVQLPSALPEEEPVIISRLKSDRISEALGQLDVQVIIPTVLADGHATGLIGHAVTVWTVCRHLSSPGWIATFT